MFSFESRQQKYHVGEVRSSHCFEIVYHNAGFENQGYTVGACHPPFSKVDDVTSGIRKIQSCSETQSTSSIAKRGLPSNLGTKERRKMMSQNSRAY